MTTNSYYTPSGTPGTQSFAASAPQRSEFASIAAGFALLPTLSAGAASRAVVVASNGLSLTLTTGTLALAGNFATTGAFATTLVAGADVSITLPTVSGLTLATLTGTETLTNKTLTTPTLTGPVTISKNSVALPSAITGTALQIGGADSVMNVALLNSFGGVNQIVGMRANGTNAAPSKLLSGNNIITIQGRGYDNSGVYSSGSQGSISIAAAEDWNSATNRGTAITFATTPIASGTQGAAVLTLANAGSTFATPLAVTGLLTATTATIASTLTLSTGDLTSATTIQVNALGGTSGFLSIGGVASLIWETNSVYPGTNNFLTLGQSSLRWSNVYSVSGNFSGALQLGNAFVATPLTSAGYMIIKDSGGVDRKVMVGT